MSYKFYVLRQILCSLVLALVFLKLASGQEEVELPKKLDPAYEKYFPNAYLSARSIVRDLITGEFENGRELDARIVSLLKDLSLLFPDSMAHETLYEKELSRVLAGAPDLGAFFISPNRKFIFVVNETNHLELTAELRAEAKYALSSRGLDTDVVEALKVFAQIYAFAQAERSRPGVKNFISNMEPRLKRWSEYTEKGRSQTFLELWVNGGIYRKKLKKNHLLLDPPKGQLILFHPNIVIENVDDALDGDQVKEGLMLEVVGYDFWDRKKPYFPSGASFVTVYSDRAGVRDWGYGAALHFGNKLTVGAVDHDGSTGWFVSADMLKLLEDKKKIVEKHAKKLKYR